MEYFWKENKRFVLSVAGALAFLLIYNMFLLSPLRRDAELAASRRARERKELEIRMSQGVPTPETLRMARTYRDRSRQGLATLVQDVAFKPGDRYKPPPRESARTFFEPLKIDVLAELKAAAVKSKIALTSPNFGFVDDVTDQSAPEFLVRLAVVERLVTLVIESEAEKIDAVDALYGLGGRDEPPQKTFLSKLSVFIKFSGRAETVFRVLHGVQKKGTYLAVSHFDLTREDPTKDSFSANLAVSLLRVDEKAPLGGATKP